MPIVEGLGYSEDGVIPTSFLHKGLLFAVRSLLHVPEVGDYVRFRDLTLYKVIERTWMYDVSPTEVVVAIEVAGEGQDALGTDSEEEERFRKLAQEVVSGWRESKARRKASVGVLPAGAIAVPADAMALIERLSETALQQRQEEAFRCMGVPEDYARGS